MLAQVCLIVSALFAGDLTLANGIRIVETPSLNDSFEIVAGYQVENQPLTSVASAFLAATNSVRTMTMAAYGAGGQLELFSDPGRLGIRVTGPLWAKPAIENELAKFFSETPEQNPALVDRAFAAQAFKPPVDFRTMVENTLRDAVLGAHIAAATSVEFNRFFGANFSTDRAFVLSSSVIAGGLDQLAARKSARAEDAEPKAASATRTFRYKPDLPVGAVIVASPTPAIYYEGWYAVLLLDRLIKRTVPGVASSLLPSVTPYYYRLEVPVPEGQFDDVVEGRLIEDLERLQFSYANAQDLEAARADAIAFLEEDGIQRWFRSLGLDSRRLEGIERLGSLSPDDVRGAARDVLADRAVASWSPKPRQVTIEIESLDGAAPATAAVNNLAPLSELSALSIPAFPPHSHNPGSGGNAANKDLPALSVMRMVLNLRLIEAGLWNDVQLEISAVAGSELKVRGDDAAKRRVLSWIRSIALDGVPADELTWAREAAIHHLDQLEPELRAVASEVQTIASTQVQDVARIYFQ